MFSQIFGNTDSYLTLQSKITVVFRESLSGGVPGKLCSCFLREEFSSTDGIAGLLFFNLPLHEVFWVPFINALKSTLPIIISMIECTNHQCYVNK